MTDINEKRDETHIGQSEDLDKIIRNAKGHCAFFVRTSECVLRNVEDENRVLPLNTNVRVTRKAMRDYLSDLQRTIDNRFEHDGSRYQVTLSIYGNCYFV